MESLEKKAIVGGFLWKFAERISSQGVSFILGVILARLLMPEEYGIVAMVQIFITIANVFITSGFCTALIQKKDADDSDFSTVFYCSMAMSLLLYLLIFISAPLIASFYNLPGLTNITRAYALILLLYGYHSVQSAWVSRHMVFKKFFFASFLGTLFSGLLGVFLAYSGYGAWAIVVQGLVNVGVNMLVLRAMITWRPRFTFSWHRAKKMMAYGSKILGADLIGTFFNELQQIIIGKMYSPADLALFNRGKQFPLLIVSNVNATIGSVLFPAMSNHSDHPDKIKRMTRKSIQLSSYIMFFCMVLLIIVAEPLIRLLLTEKWIACVPYLKLVCLANMVSVVSTANLQAIKASGYSGSVLKLELYKKPVYLALIIVSSFHSVYAIALTLPIYSVYSAIVNMLPNKKILDYSMTEQIIDFIPAGLLSGCVFLASIPISSMVHNDLYLLCIQSASAVFLYVILSYLFKVKSFTSFINLLKKNK